MSEVNDADETRWIAVCTPDNCGRLIGKRLSPDRYDEAATVGMPMPNFHLVTGLDNRPHEALRITGPHTGFRNGRLRIDPDAAFRVPGEAATMWFLADVHDQDGSMVEQAPRTLLRRQIDRLAAAGLTASMASELEFYLFEQSFAEAAENDYRQLRPFHHRHGDNDLFVTGVARGFLDALTGDLEAADIRADQIQGEGGAGQLEVNLRPAHPLAACDRHAIFKHVLKSRARLEGRAVTFMAKPFDDQAGSGGHVHLCLQGADGATLLEEGETPAGPAASFLAGLLAYSGDFMALHAPYANSYRRFHRGSFTPLTQSWAWHNRSCLVRLTGSGASARFEVRLPGADANPYFVYAAILAAGLAGIERALSLPAPVIGSAERADRPSLPRDLSEARLAFAGSDVARSAFGEEVHQHLAGLVEVELEIERRHVTDRDRLRCFEPA